METYAMKKKLELEMASAMVIKIYKEMKEGNYDMNTNLAADYGGSNDDETSKQGRKSARSARNVNKDQK